MTKNIIIEKAQEADRAFIFELSPSLAKVAKLAWHTENTVQKMQDDYMTKMLDMTSASQVLLVAKKNDIPLGFIHACERKDEISDEVGGTVTLLAVSPSAQGLGIGKLLMASVEKWAKKQGYRLMHLEVFDNNDKAKGFYQNLGFQPETLHMIKPLDMKD